MGSHDVIDGPIKSQDEGVKVTVTKDTPKRCTGYDTGSNSTNLNVD